MGKPVEWIKITPFTGNDAERIARIATSNSQLPLTPLELASVYRELRALNWSNDDIARRVGRGRDHVDRILALADANTDVQQMVARGAVSPTVAVKRVKQHGEKAGEVLAGELEQAKAEGKARVTDKKPAHHCRQCEAMRQLMQRGSWFGSTFEINTTTKAEKELVESFGGEDLG